MFLLYLTLLFSPFAIGAAIAQSARAQSFVARHYVACTATGWTAAALLVPAAVALDGTARIAALALVCPPIALGFWRRGGGGGGGGGWEDPEPPPPGVPEIDWDVFRRDLDEYIASTPRPRVRV